MISFNFFQKLCFQNLSCQTWSAAHLWVQLILSTAVYNNCLNPFKSKITYLASQSNFLHADGKISSKQVIAIVFNQLWSYHFFRWDGSKHKSRFYLFVRCADLRLYQGNRRYNNWKEYSLSLGSSGGGDIVWRQT